MSKLLSIDASTDIDRVGVLGSYLAILKHSIAISRIRTIIQEIKPITAVAVSGAVEKPIMPSSE